MRFRSFYLLSALILFALCSGNGLAKAIDPRHDYDFILLYKDGSGSFDLAIKGNEDSQAKLTFKLEGFSVYADLFLTQQLAAGSQPNPGSANYYYIYPQKIQATYQGHISEWFILDSPSTHEDKKSEKTWAFSKTIDLPLPNINYNPNEIDRWKSTLRKKMREEGFSAAFIVTDQRATGGTVRLFPLFSVSQDNKLSFVQTWDCYAKTSGRKWNGERSGEQHLGISFCDIAIGLYLRGDKAFSVPGVKWHKYSQEDPILTLEDFSIEHLSAANAGQAEFVPSFYERLSQKPYTTVKSDNNCRVNYQYSISLEKLLQGLLKETPEQWRPQGADNSNTVPLTAKINEEDINGIFRFTLFEVTSEKGYALNAGTDTDRDLIFERNQEGFSEAEETADGWIIETENKEHQATVTVRALDYGAWGKLKAEFRINGHWYPCKTEKGKTYITIPADEDEDQIADNWEKQYQAENEGATADNDSAPEGVGSKREAGDGFTNYEEYRGFFVNNEWTDTDPRHKDLFIYDELGLGIGYFQELGLQLHLIDQFEYDENRIVNYNRGYATLASQDGQKGLYLCGEDLGDGTNGEVTDIGTPNVVDKVMVNAVGIWDITADYHDGDYQFFRTNFNQAVAHELGHGVALIHHGADWAPESVYIAAGTSSVALTGGKWSGDIACVMRYEPPWKYLGWDNNIYDYPEEEQGPSRTSYCTSKKGTGINAGTQRIENNKAYPVTGDARYGECRPSVTIKGYLTFRELYE